MTRKATFAALAAVLAIAGTALAGPQTTGVLDGMTFEIRLVEQDQSESQFDTVTFDRGAFDSTACRQYGFTAAPYAVERKGDAMHFTAETTSVKEGTNRWRGIVAGDHIAGTLVWSKPGQTINYTFTGLIKK